MTSMSQRNVEQVIGRLVTDEGFRRRFAADPRAAVCGLIEGGLHLNSCEVRGLTALDPERVARFAAAIHPCIQKVELTAPDADVERRPRGSTYERKAGGGAQPTPETNSEPDPRSNAEPVGETP
jgi:hypothetical protein